MWKQLFEPFGIVSALAQETTTTTQPAEGGLFGIPWWVVVTIGLIMIVVVPSLWRRRGRGGEVSEQPPEVREVREHQQSRRLKQKEVRAIRRDIIKGLLFIGGVWLVFSPFMYVTLQNMRFSTMPFLVLTLADLGVCSSVMLHGFMKVLGRVAIRGTQKDVYGGRSKPYNMLIGPHSPLHPVKIRKMISVFKGASTNPVYGNGDPNPASNPETSEEAIVTGSNQQLLLRYQIDGEDHSTSISKERAKFVDFLDKLEVKKIIGDVNTIVERTMGKNAAKLKRYTNFLRTFMPRDDIKKEDIDEICKAIEELKPLEKNALVFGGNYLELCEVEQYDTKYVIWVLPDPWEDSFKFSDRDAIDSSYVPIPMPYTDVDWHLLGTVRIQLTPEREELANVLFPLYTDKYVRALGGAIMPHYMDYLSRYEVLNLFAEPGVSAMQALIWDLQTENLRKDKTIDESMPLLFDKLKRYVIKLLKSRSMGLRANWELIVAVASLTCLITGVVVYAIMRAQMGV